MPVSIGAPKSIRGLSDIIRNPIYATSVGLLHYGSQQRMDRTVVKKEPINQPGMVDKVKSWLLGQY